ncbi:MAG: hypothetical protein AAF846_21795, partial [Chloroflexota bacterium]
DGDEVRATVFLSQGTGHYLQQTVIDDVPFNTMLNMQISDFDAESVTLYLPQQQMSITRQVVHIHLHNMQSLKLHQWHYSNDALLIC